MGLAAGQLPDVFLLPALQTALSEGRPSPFQIVGKGIVQAGVRGIVQHGGPDNLVFKILVDIADLLGQDAHITFQGVQSPDPNGSAECSGDKVRDQSVQNLAQSGLPAAVVSNDCQEVPLRDLERNIVQGGLRGAWICIGQVVDLNRIHLSRPRSFPCSFS